ncbi:Ca2+-dependent phosphoinositide-specific phospholipase C [Jongsikchunia kroppenstedtii]|uniref:Ca2+-dependent phosphoinositide-specific phospholipase C n=1 Tax=Jongsikchunia kroppenstedtii TaxID=1121721 RepID=UPI00036E5222|nr:Ca2+-dependent phosphoinositide-specific phospholipase C [Jongsikchunia kroppenstedtii]
MPTGPVFDELPEGLRLNQIQVIGTHNSSHRMLRPDERFTPLLGRDVDDYRYEHPSLTEQLGVQGVRGLELDVYPDPDGRYGYPLARRWSGRGRRPQSLWAEPGFKVMHAPDADYRTSSPRLLDALDEIATWSAANPRHVPIFLQLELKGNWPWSRLFGGVAVPRWTTRMLDDLDAMLRARLTDRLLVPDDIRGAGMTLAQSVRDVGWPFVDDIRGRVLCFLDCPVAIRRRYAIGRPSLQGRAAFTCPEPSAADAAMLMRNDPRGAYAGEIAGLVRDGFLIRTRADEPVATARTDDLARPASALASGAHLISTDFPVPGRAFRWGSGRYVAQLPGGATVRPNPITAGLDPQL